MKKHLTTNLSLLQQYGEEGLAAGEADYESDHLSPVEIAQSAFAVHHIGISETLLNASQMYHFDRLGLPTYCKYRHSINYFAHDFGTPKETEDPRRNFETEVKGKTAQYEALLNLCKVNIPLLEEQMADVSMWSEPEPPKTPEPLAWDAWGTQRYPQSASAMVYEPQFELPPYAEGGEEALQGPGCFTTSLTYLFARSRFVRDISERVNRCIQTARNEFYGDALDSEVGDGEDGWDTGNAQRETESGEEGVVEETEGDPEVVEDEEDDEPVDQEEDDPVYYW